MRAVNRIAMGFLEVRDSHAPAINLERHPERVSAEIMVRSGSDDVINQE
jgi:hypothetical protein